MKGSWLPQKLRRLAGRNGRGNKSLSAIARKYAGIANDSHSEKSESLAKYKNANTLKYDLSKVVNGKRNTKSLIRILETEWSLSISEIREIFAEEKERIQSGRLFTPEELRDWMRIQNAKEEAKVSGLSFEEARAMHEKSRERMLA